MMWPKLSKESFPKRILVVSPTNVGDVVLTCPVIDILRADFPQAQMDVLAGPKAVSLFGDNPHFRAEVFDKRAPLRQKILWFSKLYARRYDCVVDLRHTMLPVFLMPKYSTPVVSFNSFKGHKKQAYLDRLRQLYDFKPEARKRYAVLTTGQDEGFFEREATPFLQGKSFVVIAPGAAAGDKRWHPQGFSAVADYLSASTKVVFVGDVKDRLIVEDVQSGMKNPSLSLAGKTNLRQLAFILKKSSWVLAHDSGVMHLASYLNVALIVLWGPTALEKYAPWSERREIVRRNEKCVRCQDPKAKAPHNCMSFIEVEDVIKAITRLQQ